ncbi:MAG: Rrf2 family transcriptional regulator [Planctomycetota bacterium]|nr:MAG: Rrf2 family transcriptional regulator [Planctomycetota bacterium]
MISQTVEYALRAMVHLSYVAPDHCSTDTLAGVTRVPRAYLAKVLQELRKAGLVQSQRGIGGGVRLARPATAITILEVVNAVEPIQRIHTCPLGLPSHGRRLCPLHGKLDAALATVESSFSSTTLADIVAAPHSGSKPLCDTAAARVPKSTSSPRGADGKPTDTSKRKR